MSFHYEPSPHNEAHSSTSVHPRLLPLLRHPRRHHHLRLRQSVTAVAPSTLTAAITTSAFTATALTTALLLLRCWPSSARGLLLLLVLLVLVLVLLLLRLLRVLVLLVLLVLLLLLLLLSRRRV